MKKLRFYCDSCDRDSYVQVEGVVFHRSQNHVIAYACCAWCGKPLTIAKTYNQIEQLEYERFV